MAKIVPCGVQKGDAGQWDAVLAEACTDGRVYVDIGANIGQRAIPVLHRGIPSVLIEPGIIAHRLREKVAGFPDVSVLQVALGDQDTDTVLYTNGNPTQASLYRDNVDKCQGETVVVRRRLDTVWRAVDRDPGLVKMDAQGSECRIVEGGPAFWSRVPWALIELWPAGLRASGRSVRPLVAALAACGLHPILWSNGWVPWTEDQQTAMESWTAQSHADVWFRRR